MRIRVRYRDRILEPTVVEGHQISWDEHLLRIEGSAVPFVCGAFLVQSVALADEEDHAPGIEAARRRRLLSLPGAEPGTP